MELPCEKVALIWKFILSSGIVLGSGSTSAGMGLSASAGQAVWWLSARGAACVTAKGPERAPMLPAVLLMARALQKESDEVAHVLLDRSLHACIMVANENINIIWGAEGPVVVLNIIAEVKAREITITSSSLPRKMCVCRGRAADSWDPMRRQFFAP